jgi:PAS domain S-box-containing protein
MSGTPTQQNVSASTYASLSTLSTTDLDLRSFLDMLPDGMVIIDAAGNMVQVNRQAELIFGYAHEELEGKPLGQLLPTRFQAVHAAHMQRYFSAPRVRQMGVGLHLVGKRKDGTEFPVEISLAPLLIDGQLHAVGAVRDVSAQHALERESIQHLQQIRQQIQLINLAHDAIIVRDPVSRIISWNKGAQDLYGWTEQAALGRITHTLLQTHFPIDYALIEAEIERVDH